MIHSVDRAIHHLQSEGKEGEKVWLRTRFVLINVMWLWQSAPTNSSRPWYSCLFPSMRQIHLITVCHPREMEQGVGARRLVAALHVSGWLLCVRVVLPVCGSCQLHVELPSSLFACNIMRAAGHSTLRPDWECKGIDWGILWLSRPMHVPCEYSSFEPNLCYT